MAVCRVSFGVLVAIVALFAVALPLAHAQSPVSAPSPSPTSDGATIDQGVAYVLMLVALVLAYLIH